MKRAALVVALSLGLHLAIFFLTPRIPHPPAKPPPERVSVEIRDAPPKKPLQPDRVPAHQPRKAVPPKRLAETKQPPLPVPPLPTPMPPTPEPEKRGSNDLEAEKAPPEKMRAPPSPPAPPAPDPSKVRLFDPDVVGRSVARMHVDAPKSDRMQPGGGDDPNSARAERERVSSRVTQGLQEASSAAAVQSGFLSQCDDGIDNGWDGLTDCADPGCRQLPLCDYTGVYEDEHPGPIPEDEGGLVRSMNVGQEGTIRKFSLTIEIRHGAPGDLAITLVAPNGERAVLRNSDRGNSVYERSYYARPFIGMRASGRWTLIVEDRVMGTTGLLRSWTMFVTS